MPEPTPVSPVDGRFRFGRVLFVLIEIALLTAVPVLAFFGFSRLLQSTAGEFVVTPGPDDPGWQAFVDPTPVLAVIEMRAGSITGVALVIGSGAGAGGAVLLIPGSMLVTDTPLTELAPDKVVASLERLLKLRIHPMVIADRQAWEEVLGESEIEVENPDPIEGPDGEVLPVGELLLSAKTIPSFLGSPSGNADVLGLEFRRAILWTAMLQRPPAPEGPETSGSEAQAAAADVADPSYLSLQLRQLSAGTSRVEAMPVTVDGDLVRPDVAAVPSLVGELVAFPAGAAPGDRQQVRIVDRAGTNDLAAVARALGAAGFEVVQIGNAAVFDEGPSQVLTTGVANSEMVAALADLTKADIVVPVNDEEAVSTVTLLLADDAFASSTPGE